LVAEARRRAGGAIDPLSAYRAIDYRQAMIDLRGATSVSTGL
jgi:L-rhamnose isomerase/sugar isomerase